MSELPKRKTREFGIPPTPEVIEKTTRMTLHKGQFIVRIPKTISQFLKIKKGDKFSFIVEVAQSPSPKEESKLSFKIMRSDGR